jgi:Ca2+-dependent lipid-binding protein
MLAKRARLEVLLDDGYWPAFSTVKPRSTHANWDIIGEGVIKELDFGRVWLRLNDADEGDKDDIISEWRGDAKEFLQKTLARSFQYRVRTRTNPTCRRVLASSLSLMRTTVVLPPSRSSPASCHCL